MAVYPIPGCGWYMRGKGDAAPGQAESITGGQLAIPAHLGIKAAAGEAS